MHQTLDLTLNMTETTAMEDVDTIFNSAVPVDIDPDWDAEQDSTYEGTS